MPSFAILVHEEPRRLLELLKCLQGYNVYIHIDKYSNREIFLSEIQTIDHSKIHIVPEAESIGGAWGGYSLVNIQLKLMEKFLRNANVDGPLVFLSGQDYPIRPIDDFVRYLQTKQDFISVQQISAVKIAQGDLIEISRLNRIRKIHLQDFRFFRMHKNRASIEYVIGSIPANVIRRLHIPRIGFDTNKRFFVGSQWVGLSVEMCKLLVNNKKSLREEFKFSFCPDELVIQTFYGRTFTSISKPDDNLEVSSDSVIDADFHLIHKSLNHFWGLTDLATIKSSTKFFLRKPSFELLDYLIDSYETGSIN